MHYVLLGLQLDSTTLAHFVAHFANKDYVRSRVQLSSSSPGPFPNATGRINPEASAGRAYTEAEVESTVHSSSPSASALALRPPLAWPRTEAEVMALTRTHPHSSSP
jgi:hypothetical protein